MSDRPPSPTPSEREKIDKEAKAKEEAEQAALPYKWIQSIKDVDVTVLIDGKYKGKDLDVKISKTALKVAIKGGEVFIEVRCLHLRKPVLVRNSRQSAHVICGTWANFHLLYRANSQNQYVSTNQHGH